MKYLCFKNVFLSSVVAWIGGINLALHDHWRSGFRPETLKSL